MCQKRVMGPAKLTNSLMSLGRIKLTNSLGRIKLTSSLGRINLTSSLGPTKLTNSLGRTNLTNSLGKQQTELSTRTWRQVVHLETAENLCTSRPDVKKPLKYYNVAH